MSWHFLFLTEQRESEGVSITKPSWVVVTLDNISSHRGSFSSSDSEQNLLFCTTQNISAVFTMCDWWYAAWDTKIIFIQSSLTINTPVCLFLVMSMENLTESWVKHIQQCSEIQTAAWSFTIQVRRMTDLEQSCTVKHEGWQNLL